MDIVVLGAVISEKMKEEYTEMVNKLLESFYPLHAKDCIEVNFVPVIANP